MRCDVLRCVRLAFRRAFDVRQHPPVDAVKDRVREQPPVAGGPHVVSIPGGPGDPRASVGQPSVPMMMRHLAWQKLDSKEGEKVA